MKRLIALLLCVLMLGMCSCANIVRNRIGTEYLHSAVCGEALYIKSHFSYDYRIDLEGHTFTRLSSDFEGEDLTWSTDEVFEYEFFAGEYFLTAPQGYESVAESIEERFGGEDLLLYAYGQLYGGVLVGFVQIYENDGNGYAVETLSHSVLFRYGYETDEFIVRERFDGAAVVAVHGDTVVYWKDKAYYRYDLATQAEEYLLEDAAYDAGLSQLSIGTVLSNSEYCVIHLRRAEGNQNTDFMYLLNFSTKEFFTLNERKE